MFGNAYLEQGNLAAAATEFKKAVIADSTYAKAYNNLGLISTRRSNLGEAAQYFYKAISKDPNVAETYINYASTFLLRNDPNSSIQILEQAKQRFPLNDFVMLKLAAAYFQAGRKSDALNAVQESLKLNPTNMAARQLYQQISSDTTGG